MKLSALILLCLASVLAVRSAESTPRPLVDLNTGYFPFHSEGLKTTEDFAKRKKDVRERILLAAGLFPLPTKTPLNPVIHSRIERDDYTIDHVYFESFPGHYVTGNLYLPKNPPNEGKMPGILCPYGHWPQGRFIDVGAESKATLEQLAIGAERFECGARSPLQARCVQLARMGCAVFHYDMLGTADSIQITGHRSGKRPDLDGSEPGTFGFYSAAADLRLQSNFGLQTWNSLRSLDFILSLPYVDPARISCTGASGGGTQTLMLAAIDDRLATAFPCVMTSTAMQGGCTCENANYLRINLGNIDIAANFAPKPMGMTAANDWTKELATKGFPDLKAVWTALGRPDDVTATFNTHWLHNYNHVSRTTMYGFMNRYFNLGLSEPVLEREFVLTTPEELSVWNKDHPKPEGDRVGASHEKALLKRWSEDSDKQIAGNPEAIGRAWELMIDCDIPKAGDVSNDILSKEEAGGHLVVKTVIHNSRDKEDVPCTFISPTPDKWNGVAVIWLSHKGVESLGGEAGPPPAGVQKLLDAGVAIACPALYLAGAMEQPRNLVKSKDREHRDWQWAACYTYGYNPTLTAHQAHDAMTVLAMIRNHPTHKASKVIIVGSDGAGIAAAATASVAKAALDGAVIDTEGFRFASLHDQWHPLFVPGAVKYGDVPGLLSTCDSSRLVTLGEKEKGGTEAIAGAVAKWVR